MTLKSPYRNKFAYVDLYDWYNIGQALYGADQKEWEFQCPQCGHVQLENYWSCGNCEAINTGPIVVTCSFIGTDYGRTVFDFANPIVSKTSDDDPGVLRPQIQDLLGKKTEPSPIVTFRCKSCLFYTGACRRYPQILSIEHPEVHFCGEGRWIAPNPTDLQSRWPWSWIDALTKAGDKK